MLTVTIVVLMTEAVSMSETSVGFGDVAPCSVAEQATNKISTVVVEWLTLLLRILKVSVQVSGWRPAILTDIFLFFFHSLQVNIAIVSNNYATTDSFHILSNYSLITLSFDTVRSSLLKSVVK
jgi:hypothetical protein